VFTSHRGTIGDEVGVGANVDKRTRE
jgi:hypothetical protein